MQYEFHEVANIFPMMSESEFAGLVEDIRKSGQIEPIWIYQQKIIDGRNRYNACLRIGIEPVVKEWDGKGSLVDFAVSKNFHRRQLNASQRAMVGARIKHIFEDDAKHRQIEKLKQGEESPLAQKKANGGNDSKAQEKAFEDQGKSSSKAAKLVNSSQSSVEAATRVLRDAIPEVAEAVEKGHVSVTRADTIAKLPKEQQPEILKKVIANEPIVKPKPVIPPEPSHEPGYMEGADALREILENISLQLGTLIGHAETELSKLPKTTVRNVKYQIGASVDGIRQCAERLELSLKMYK